MKKIEKDYEYLETSPKMQERGLRRISRPKFLDDLKTNVSLRDCKSRITIYLDADIIEFFKQAAEESGNAYQTLINQTLRGIVDGSATSDAVLTEDKLFDKDFLTKLKAELETV